MGLGGISLWQLLIILAIVILIFGTKRMRTLGSDLGGAVRGFRKAMNDGEKEEEKRAIEDKEAESAPDAQFSESAPKREESKNT